MIRGPEVEETPVEVISMCLLLAKNNGAVGN